MVRKIQVDEIRIRRLDRHNVVIETLDQVGKRSKTGERQWHIWKYYGKVSDLVEGLITLTVEIEQSRDLKAQLTALSGNIDKTRDSIISHLKSCGDGLSDV